MQRDSMIEARNLSIGYRLGRRGRKVLYTELSFGLRRGELTCLLGPNGAGKSTLLRTISGSQRPLGGSILLEGRELSICTEQEISRKIGLVLTDKTMTGGLTVFDLVSLGRHPHTGFFGRLKEKDYTIIRDSLDAVGIGAKADHYVAELSDGERQKVMIARALAQECPVLLLDEPTAFLDVVSRSEIMSLLHKLAAEQGKTILLSTHDLEQALLLSDRLWLLSRTEGLQCGITEELVFRGTMDHFFARNEIVFDKTSGSFRPLPSQGIQVQVEASGELLFWVNNILMRNGFCCATEGKDVAFLLQAGAPDDFILRFPDGRIDKFTSFAELDTYLKNAYKL